MAARLATPVNPGQNCTEGYHSDGEKYGAARHQWKTEHFINLVTPITEYRR
jgi:hypothetical protein